MSVAVQGTTLKAPTTYTEWLDCLKLMRELPVNGNSIFELVTAGTFEGTQVTAVALQKQIVETVNAILDKSIKRFGRDLNEYLSFNEFFQIDLLFRRLKSEIHKALFFEKLDFLPFEFRKELAESVKKQMTAFWNDTVRFLYEQSIDCSGMELEDALFLVKRIHLF